MIVIFGILIGILVIAVLFVILGLLYLIHETLIDYNPNYAYYATKGKIVKVTYGNSSVRFHYKKNTVFGLPFLWFLEKDAYSYEEAKREMDRQLGEVNDKRVIKRQTLR